MNSNHSQKPNEDINQLIQAYQQTRSEDLATVLLQNFHSMIRMVARKLSRNRPDLFDDLFQVGQISLVRSLEHFDCTQGTVFEAYAMKSLIGHMKNYLRDKSWYIQVPRRIKEKGTHVQQAIDTLTVQLERSPDVKEIAQYLELSIEDTIEILSARDNYLYISLDSPLKQEENGTSLKDLIGSEADDYQTVENRIDLQLAIEQLGQEEKTVLQLAFIQNESQRTIANLLGISQMSVSRIQKRAVAKLKQILTTTPPPNRSTG